MTSRTDTVSFKDNGITMEVTWGEVLDAAKRLSEFFRAIQARFVERDGLIKVLKYALILREHILIYGPTGTAKTAIADTVIRNIQGAKAWSMDLSKFMTENRVFGDFDVKKAQETGQLFHMTAGSLLEAHFANLGEFLDANVALLRALLRVLNEREFIRGPQKLKSPLMTALANTNVNPVEVVAKNPELEAVLDRFLFWHNIQYVQKPENRLRMLQMFMENRYDAPLPPLSIEDIELVSGVVLRTNLLHNEFIVQAYEELARTFAEKRGRPISDRRFNKGVQILEASALLDGATEVDWDDLDRSALVLVDDARHVELFATVLQEVKAKWRDGELQNQVNQESLALEALLNRIPTRNLLEATTAELVDMKRDLLRLRGEVSGFGTTSANGHAKKQQVLETVAAKLTEVQSAIDNI